MKQFKTNQPQDFNLKQRVNYVQKLILTAFVAPASDWIHSSEEINIKRRHSRGIHRVKIFYDFPITILPL